MKKAKDFRDMSMDELEATYRDQLKELFDEVNKMKLAKKAEKPHLVSQLKKEIARLLTVKREKQLANS